MHTAFVKHAGAPGNRSEPGGSRYPDRAMADDDKKTPENEQDDGVLRHPLAAKMRRALDAHPILKLQKKVEIRVEGERVIVSGTVYTINMYFQLIDLARRVADGDPNLDVEVVPEIQPPAGRELEGRVPSVSPGSGATKSDFSTDHLKKKRWF